MTTAARPALDPFRVTDASFVAGATRAEQLPPPVLAEIAFAGRSNVGKSSLMNALLQRKNLVRTSSTPGCTRQINVFQCGLVGDLSMHLVDLPGYGYAKLSKKEKSTWGAMIEGYIRDRATLRAIVLLVDVRRGVEPDDRELLEFVAATRGNDSRDARAVTRILVATKLDKLSVSKRKPALAAFRKAFGVDTIGFSAVTGDGRQELWTRLRAAIT